MRESKYIPQLVLHIVLLAATVIMIGPFIWGLLAAFKPSSEIIAIPMTFLPKNPTLRNFISLFSREGIPFGRYYINSTIVTSIVVAGTLFLCSLTGYIFAKFSFPCKKLLFFTILATMMIPFQVLMVPLYLMFFRMHLINTYAGLILPSLITAFGIFLMRQFIETVPTDLIDAGRLDGCSEFGIFLRLIVPLAKPAMVAYGIFSFLWTWNDYLWPLIVINSVKLRTLPVGISSLSNVYGILYGEVLAAVMLSIGPVIIAYFIFQKHFVSGISLTGLKG